MFILGKFLDELWEVLSDYEMVVYFFFSYSFLIKKCVCNRYSLLYYVVINNQLYIVQFLLLKGVSFICKDDLGRILFIVYFYNGGYLLDVVF